MKKNQNRIPVKTMISFVNIAVILTVFVCIAASFIILERPKESELERRPLAEFPEFSFKSLLSGEYTKAVSKYYNDTIPHRDFLKTISSSLMEYSGLRIDNSKLHGNISQVATSDEPFVDDPSWWGITDTDKTVDSDLETNEPSTTSSEASGIVTQPPETIADESAETTVTAADTTSPETTSPETTSKESQDQSEIDKNDAAISGGILVCGNRGMALYGGSYNYARGYSACLSRYRSDLGDSVNLYSVTIPTAVGFYLPEKYSSYSANQYKDLEFLREIIKDAQDAAFVDVYGALADHTSEPIYSRTDHHWAPLGAYYAARQLAEDAGVPFRGDLENDYEKVVKSGYVGTLYSFSKDAALLWDPEDFVYYKPTNTYQTYYYNPDFENGYPGPLFFNTTLSNSYCSFLGADNIIAKIKTDVENGRKLMVIKDSFGNAMIPFLTGSFEEIYVVDLRYFTPNAISFIKSNGITDVAFTLCIQDVFGGWMKNLEIIRTQNPERSADS